MRLAPAAATCARTENLLSSEYFHIDARIDIREYRIDRIMYGSDFPNIPHAWDRELKWLRDSGLSDHDLDRLLNKNAAAFFNLDD